MKVCVAKSDKREGLVLVQGSRSGLSVRALGLVWSCGLGVNRARGMAPGVGPIIFSACFS